MFVNTAVTAMVMLRVVGKQNDLIMCVAHGGVGGWGQVVGMLADADEDSTDARVLGPPGDVPVSLA